jgi:hypothetical protein
MYASDSEYELWDYFFDAKNSETTLLVERVLSLSRNFNLVIQSLIRSST